MSAAAPEWARWPQGREDGRYSLGIEEEVMLLEPGSWSLAQAIDDVLPRLPGDLRARASSETHSSAPELTSGVHATVAEAVADMGALRAQLGSALGEMGLAAASCGTQRSRAQRASAAWPARATSASSWRRSRPRSRPRASRAEPALSRGRRRDRRGTRRGRRSRRRRPAARRGRS